MTNLLNLFPFVSYKSVVQEPFCPDNWGFKFWLFKVLQNYNIMTICINLHKTNVVIKIDTIIFLQKWNKSARYNRWNLWAVTLFKFFLSSLKLLDGSYHHHHASLMMMISVRFHHSSLCSCSQQHPQNTLSQTCLTLHCCKHQSCTLDSACWFIFVD